MNHIFCAVDTSDLSKAEKLAEMLKGEVGGFKLGLEFFLAHGVNGYKAIASKGLPIFLDVKLHDIPNTVAGAVKSLLPLQPAFITLHASGGPAMMRAATEAAATAGALRPKLLAVTVLTSLDKTDLAAIGQDEDTSKQVVRLGKLAKESGVDGCVCSAEEILHLRAAVGNDFVLMVPGIRPSWSAANDQKRTLTPRQAYDAGATYLVIGRPITKAENPAEAARRIVEEMDCK
ncbi:MAG: orotidine-5'-phosphate decarboxylase [Bdellovibrionales bacterium]